MEVQEGMASPKEKQHPEVTDINKLSFQDTVARIAVIFDDNVMPD